ncbi:hypothetical protein PI124_g13481 [Phytophthora idaei]|nr:hypothetical protein PI125_g17684 [Phytophthora idaei]KAG3241678.1 hypothetical protein PI124_g13481 [Phytophthora idaei]
MLLWDSEQAPNAFNTSIIQLLDKCSAIPNGSTINLKGKDDLWAPDVQKLGDWYYLYYSVSSFGSQNSAIGVARSRSMDVGTWEDGGAVITSDPSKPFNAIDPNLIHVGNEIYLNFGSSWQDIYQVHLRNPPVLPSVDPYQIGFTSDREEVAAATTKNDQLQARSTASSHATGSFVDKDGVDCKKGGGTVGQGVYNDPKHGPILYYHYVDTTIGYADGQKRFGWNKINFSSGWPVV